MPVGKLHFTYSAMNAGKSTMLLQSAHNYRERGMRVVLWTSVHHLDEDGVCASIESRIGLKQKAQTYKSETNLFDEIIADHKATPLDAVFLDEAQFLTKEQVWQLADLADETNLPVFCYGLRTDFQGELFEGSATLLAIADVLQEIRTICHCGRPAIMTARIDPSGEIVRGGNQIKVQKAEYISLCRAHWKARMTAADKQRLFPF